MGRKLSFLLSLYGCICPKALVYSVRSLVNQNAPSFRVTPTRISNGNPPRRLGMDRIEIQDFWTLHWFPYFWAIAGPIGSLVLGSDIRMAQ
jgi:hypothetical protein